LDNAIPLGFTNSVQIKDPRKCDLLQTLLEILRIRGNIEYSVSKIIRNLRQLNSNEVISFIYKTEVQKTCV
jgi:hypothetical protein